MLKFDITDYGVRFELSGIVKVDEIQQFSDLFHQYLETNKDTFCVFADFKGVELIPSEGKKIISECQTNARKTGMLRSVVTVKDNVTKLQFKTIARQTGIYVWERYIDTSKYKNWEEMALDWLLDSVDPDQHEDEKTNSL